MNNDWSLHTVGWPWWVVLIFSAVFGCLVIKFLNRELAAQPAGVRQGLRALRCASLVAAGLFLLQPSLTSQRNEYILPKVAVMIDTSGSMTTADEHMAIGMRLDEAIALGFLDSASRPDGFKNVVRYFSTVQNDAIAIGRALRTQAEAWQRGEFALGNNQTIALAEADYKRGSNLVGVAAGVAAIADQVSAQATLLGRAARQLRRRGPEDVPDEGADNPGILAALIEELEISNPRWIRTALAAQEAADQALVAGAEAGSPVAAGMEQLKGMRRIDRAVFLTERTIKPLLKGRADVQVMALKDRLGELNPFHPVSTDDIGGTDFFGPLAQLARNWSQTYAGGIIVCSDGRQTAGGDAVPVIQALRARGVTLSTVVIGDPAIQPDAVVADFSGPTEVSRGEPIHLDARLRIAGYPGSDWDLVLTKDGDEIERRRISAQGQWQQERFMVEIHGMRELSGMRTFQVKLEPSKSQRSVSGAVHPDEVSQANNSAECTVNVNDDPLRVLAIDSTPRWEVRNLVHMLERDRRVHATCRYRSVRHEGNLLPSGTQLGSLDMIILGDLPPGELGSDDQERLEEFVTRYGGFVIVIAGPRGMPSGYSLGSLANLLPVRIIGSAAATMKPVRQHLTEFGATHPITVLADDQNVTKHLWASLPPLPWLATAVVAKPGATVLLEADSPEHTPVVVAGRQGAGRVVWVGSGETWRWRDPLGDQIHKTFWTQAIRWGLSMRLRGQDHRLQVAIDRTLVTPRDQIEVRARSRLTTGDVVDRPLRLRAEAIDDVNDIIDGSKREYELELVEGADLFHMELPPLPEGRWRITVYSNHPALAGVEEIREIKVRARRASETLDTSADPAHLARLANAGGGISGDLAAGENIAAELANSLHPRVHQLRRTINLWNNYVGILFITATLAGEWIWRRRRGLP